MDSSGRVHEGGGVAEAFVKHFEFFLGNADTVTDEFPEGLFTNKVEVAKASHMVRDVTDNEVKLAMFSISDIKAPGPDGYSAKFFKEAWSIVGKDICGAVRDFFRNGSLLSGVNHTTLALIPKVSTPLRITDYRPISCCNVLYKCISKIITNRIKEALDDVVSMNQSAFIPGRSISDNILLSQELMLGYHLDRGPPRCAFKVDIQKAYDTVDWCFLRKTLRGFGFHPKMIVWIMSCISSPSFSLSINGNIHGFFKGKRGLRQGDPMSPYLFTLVMEVLSLILNRKVAENDSFRYHPRCEILKIVNICFADDLFLFSYGNDESAKVIMDSLTLFKQLSGLVPSMPKSTAFFCNVSEAMRAKICDIMPFEVGSLPIRYLGVPLISSRLVYQDCSVLVERIENRISSWKNRFLSFAGRIQLIKSVLSSLHLFWASVFCLPKRIIHLLEQKMRNFLWDSGGLGKGKAKVPWTTLCLPKIEGGLGIRRIEDMNKALLTSHIWSILSLRKSLWVQWVYEFRIKNRNFWEIPCRGILSWGWRKILLIRVDVRPFFRTRLGNGRSTSMWFDKWCDAGPLGNFISNRMISAHGYRLDNSVSDVCSRPNWEWPQAWLDLFPVLLNQPRPVLSQRADAISLCAEDGSELQFCTAAVWELLRPRGERVGWVSVAWFSHSIPKHSFMTWLVMHRKLKTHDRLKPWEVGGPFNLNLLCCVLCRKGTESHEHLFFTCPYSCEVWKGVKTMLAVGRVTDSLDDLVLSISNSNPKRRYGYARRLSFAATIYHIWRERNNRMFTNHARPPDVLQRSILEDVRLRMMSTIFFS